MGFRVRGIFFFIFVSFIFGVDFFFGIIRREVLDTLKVFLVEYFKFRDW